MIDKLQIGQKIKEFRQRAGKSQLQLEVDIEASTGSISRIESGKINPTKETLFKIAQILNLTSQETAELFGIEMNVIESQAGSNPNTIRDINPYDIIVNLDINDIADKFFKEIKSLGFFSLSLYLVKNSNTYFLYKAEIPEDVMQLASILLDREVYRLDYSLSDKSLITEAIVEKTIKTSDEVFDILIPLMGSIYSLKGHSSASKVIAVPLFVNSFTLGCLVLQTKEDIITHKIMNRTKKIVSDYSKKIYILKLTKDADEYINITSKDRSLRLGYRVKELLSITYFFNILKFDWIFRWFLLTFFLFCFYWVLSQALFSESKWILDTFAYIYYVVLLFAVISGLFMFNLVGRFENKLGQFTLLLTMISVGHLFGQIYYSMYALITGDFTPYPSIGDYGYFSGTLFSLLLSYQIFKYSNIKYIHTSNIKNRIYMYGIMLFIILFSFYIKVLEPTNYELPNEVYLLMIDFAYALGQSLAVSIAFTGLFILKSRILCKETTFFLLIYFISALLLYFADVLYTLRVSSGLFYPSDIADFLYFLYYSLISFCHVFLFAILRIKTHIKRDDININDYQKSIKEIANSMIV